MWLWLNDLCKALDLIHSVYRLSLSLRLLSSIRPGLVKKINRLPTPVATQVSFCSFCLLPTSCLSIFVYLYIYCNIVIILQYCIAALNISLVDIFRHKGLKCKPNFKSYHWLWKNKMNHFKYFCISEMFLCISLQKYK